MGEIISFPNRTNEKMKKQEPTFEVEITPDGKRGAFIKVTKYDGRPTPFHMYDHVTSWIDVDKKAKKCAERMIKRWKKQDATDPEPVTYTIH